jgi:hypothetical protein
VKSDNRVNAQNFRYYHSLSISMLKLFIVEQKQLLSNSLLPTLYLCLPSLDADCP